MEATMTAGEDRLSPVFRALADPTRRAILGRLAGGDATVAELAAPFTMSQPAISRHLRVLEDAGLISRTRRATARLSHLEAEPLRDATRWLARYRQYWQESHDRLDELLAALQDGPPQQGPPQHGPPQHGPPQHGPPQHGPPQHGRREDAS
jgi:DNA-binding transcriptional ArsR family regulator